MWQAIRDQMVVDPQDQYATLAVWMKSKNQNIPGLANKCMKIQVEMNQGFPHIRLHLLATFWKEVSSLWSLLQVSSRDFYFLVEV